MVGNSKFHSRVIIDASIALAFLLPDERKQEIDLIFLSLTKNKIKILVPGIFYYEVLNGIRSAVLRKRISLRLAKNLLKRFLKFKIINKSVNWEKTFELALKKKISFYDAAYLWLSKEEKIPLFSLDNHLLKKRSLIFKNNI